MRLKLKSIFPTLYDFVNFSIETITSFYPDFIDMHNYEPLQAEIERYICKPIYRQFKNSSCNYLPTEEGIDAFKDQFSNQLEEVVFDFLLYTSANINYFNEAYNLEGQNLEQNVNTINSPINQQINNTKATTNIASGATAQSINLMVYNGKTTWRKAFSSYYTPQRKSELIDSFRWLFINFYTDDEDGAVIVEIEEELNMVDGNQVITHEDNEIVRKVTIVKPETLTPNNIRKDVNIGGVVGDIEGAKNEVQLTLPLDMANGNMVITPYGDDVLSAVTINKPDTLVPENIKKGVNIGGVIGEMEGGNKMKEFNFAIVLDGGVFNDETANNLNEFFNYIKNNINSIISVQIKVHNEILGTYICQPNIALGVEDFIAPNIQIPVTPDVDGVYGCVVVHYQDSIGKWKLGYTVPEYVSYLNGSLLNIYILEK